MRGGRRGLRLFLALAGVLSCATAVSAQAPSARPLVTNLEFVGNDVFPDDSLALAIFNRQTECRHWLLSPFCWMELGFADDTEYLNRRELPRDVLRLRYYYYQRGYREAVVDTALAYAADSAEVALTFTIEEGEPVVIDSLVITGAEDAEVPDLLENLPIARGDPLSAIALEAVNDTLVDRLQNAGYPRAEVFRTTDIPRGSRTARVTLDVDPGPRARFGDFAISVNGEAELSETVIRRMIPFEEGSRYSSARIQQAQRNLYDLEIVRNALIEEDSVRWAAGPDTLVPLNVVVATSTLHRVRLGGGWSQAECLNAEARWASRNFLGGARRLQVRGRVSNVLAEELHGSACDQSGVGDDFGGLNWSLSSDLNQPWLLSPRNSGTVSVFWERQTVPDIFVRQAYGLSFVGTRSVGARMPLVLAYRPQRASLEAAEIFFCTSFLVCRPEDVAILQEPNWLSPVGIGLSVDRTDNIIDPSEGYSAHVDLEYASIFTGSDFAYTRAVADASWYRQLARRTVLAGRARAGWVGAAEFADIVPLEGIQIIHPQKRFFAGGANSVRGFAQNRLGPRVLTVGVTDLVGPASVEAVVGTDTVFTFAGPCTPEQVASFTCDANPLEDGEFTPRPTGGNRLFEVSVEYRFAFAASFQGVTFLDVGQVWSEEQSLDLGSLEWSPGLGVRYFSPIGPLRMDLAYRFQGAQELVLVTPGMEPFDPTRHVEGDRIALDVLKADGEAGKTSIPWVRQERLAIMAPPVLFGEDLGFLRRLQLHISIGQAF